MPSRVSPSTQKNHKASSTDRSETLPLSPVSFSKSPCPSDLQKSSSYLRKSSSNLQTLPQIESSTGSYQLPKSPSNCEKLIKLPVLPPIRSTSDFPRDLPKSPSVSPVARSPVSPARPPNYPSNSRLPVSPARSPNYKSCYPSTSRSPSYPSTSRSPCYPPTPPNYPLTSPDFPSTSKSPYSLYTSKSPCYSSRSPTYSSCSYGKQRSLGESPLSDSLSISPAISPETEFRLTQQRLKEYYTRQEGLAEKRRRKVADAIAVATKYLSRPYDLPEIKVKDFLKICEIEAKARRLKTCQRASYFIKNELCETDECVQCQLNRLREGINRIYPPNRYRCELHCGSPTMDGGGERRSPTTSPVNICRRVDLISRHSSVKTPPPAPASSPFIGSIITPETRVHTATCTTGIGFTPDSEYDNGKINELINKYIPKPKVVHYQCRPRTRMFLYTEKTRMCNIVHHPYAAYRGKKALTGCGKKKKTITVIEQAVFKVPNLGVVYTLPDINPNLGPRQTSSSPTPPHYGVEWNNVTLLPPIKGQWLEDDD